ncbi:MAG: hypothetical protein ACK5NF_03410 [Bacilli bacterium]
MYPNHRYAIDLVGESGSRTFYADGKTLNKVQFNVEKNDEIELFQAGGLLEDKSAIVVYEGDKLMQEKNIYIIETSVQSDGTLLASVVNNNTKLNLKSKSSLQNDQQYNDYLNYAENEIEFERERFEITE